jgi:hypothetical protein
MLLSNTGEGVSGATVASTDTTAGDAFGSVSIGAGHTITYSNVQEMHGNTSIRHTAGASSAGGYTAWTSTQLVTAPTTIYVRFYVYFSTLPSAITTFASFYNNTTLRGSIRTNANNTIRVADNFSLVIVDSTVALTAGAWYRIEVRFFGSSSLGNADLRLYAGDAGTALQTVTTGAPFNTGGAINTVRFGNVVPTVNVDYWLDGIAINDTGYFGAEVYSPPYNPPLDIPTDIPVDAGSVSQLVATKTGVYGPGYGG